MPNKPAIRFSRDCNQREPAAAGSGQRPVLAGRTTSAVRLLRRLAAFAYFPTSHPRGARCAGLRETLGT